MTLESPVSQDLINLSTNQEEFKCVCVHVVMW